MCDIPEDRLECFQPFTYCGVVLVLARLKMDVRGLNVMESLHLYVLKNIELEIIFGHRLLHKCVEALPKSKGIQPDRLARIAYTESPVNNRMPSWRV